jgi:Flp pilus assembly protein TadG
MTERARDKKDEHGAALLEFALVIPLFIYVLYSIIAFGAALSLREDVTHAAAEAARATLGVVNCTQTNLTTCQAAASTRATNILGWVGSPSDISVTSAASSCATSNDPAGWCITVTVTYDKSIVPSEPGLGVFIPTGSSATATVQVQ